MPTATTNELVIHSLSGHGTGFGAEDISTVCGKEYSSTRGFPGYWRNDPVVKIGTKTGVTNKDKLVNCQACLHPVHLVASREALPRGREQVTTYCYDNFQGDAKWARKLSGQAVVPVPTKPKVAVTEDYKMANCGHCKLERRQQKAGR